MSGTPRQWRQSVSGVIALLLLIVGLVGCSNRLIPPEQLQVPVTVHLVDHGRHPSLILPAPETGWVRYVYGEWRWYADNDTGFWRGMGALFWPTDAAIGRGRLESVPEPDEYSPAIPEGFREIHSFAVEKEQVRALRSKLARYFEDPAKTHFQPRYNLWFVPYPVDYSFAHQSNQVMVQWLRKLGVTVEGPGLFSDWRLDSRADGP